VKNKYAIVWSTGRDLYTHQDEAGKTILYSLEELLRDAVPLWGRAPEDWPGQEDGQVAVSVDALNEFLGL
jgi:hypothetical protein